MSTIALRRSLDQSRLYDWAMRLPIVVYSFYVLIRDVAAFCDQVIAQPALFEQPDGGVIIATLARVSQWMFVALLAVLPLFRHRPIAKSEEILPRLGALIAVGMPPLFMLLDRAEPSLAFNLIAVVACLSANVMAVITLSFLGRSLSIMPEARVLVTGGPYALVRHPLYLFELLGVVGIVLQVRSLPAVAMMVLVIALQVARARWEEAVLTRAFPEFAGYARRTPFLIPRDPRAVLGLFRRDPAARWRSVVVVGSALALLAFAMIVLPKVIA